MEDVHAPLYPKGDMEDESDERREKSTSQTCVEAIRGFSERLIKE